VNFRTDRDIPAKRKLTITSEEVPAKTKGKPADEERWEAFLQVATYIQENDDEQITLSDLRQKMCECLAVRGCNKEPYTEKYLRQKLEDYFGDSIIVTCIRGKANVVTFRSTAEKIVRQFSQEKNVNRESEEEKLRIIKTAAKLLLADIKSMDTSRDEYPSRSDMENTQKNLEYILASLQLFLTTLLSNKKDNAVKMASLGQALIQAARPKVVLTPWQLGLAVELHHLYASKYLIRHLNRLGFCCTYDEVKRFLQNAALTQGVELDGMFGESCVQFVADNVDHNIRTLDGQGTFHGMGMIAAVTPATRTVRRIKRDTTINAKHVEAAGRIQMKFWSAKESQQRLVYEMLPNFSGSQAHSFIDMVWNVSWPLRSPRPGWSGFMQAVSHGTHPGQTHRIPWRKGDTFRQICETYSEYVCRHFAESIVVFDGYGSGPTTKDQVHLRRSSRIIGPEVHNLSPDKRLSFSKDVFLSNNSNKQAFVYLLSEALEASGCNVLHATGDADTLIVRTALKTSIDSNTFVIGEDTDLLVLLCHHIDQDKKCVYFRSYKTTTKQKQWHIQEVQQHLGPEACHLLPFLHAVNGCDTTSRLFGTGKGAPLKKVKITGDTGFKRAGNIFCSTGQNQQTVVEAGEKALVALLNGKPGDSLDVLRYQRFTEKSATAATAVQIHTLPPTSAAAKYHSLRVYFQVQEWICLEQKLDPLDWGWSLSNRRLEPKTTDRPPAPESLLRVVRCDCSTSNCRTKQCTCKGLGLECTLACGECKGLSCENSPHIEELDVPDIMDSTDVHTAPLPDLGDLSDFLRVLH
jgi:hypothetical protein